MFYNLIFLTLIKQVLSHIKKEITTCRLLSFYCVKNIFYNLFNLSFIFFEILVFYEFCVFHKIFFLFIKKFCPA